MIETPETCDYLKIGEIVSILFKETEVSIAKNLSGGISLRNRITSTIKSMKKGKILSEIVLDYKDKEVTSIITRRSCDDLELCVGDKVVGLVKSNEVAIAKAKRHDRT